MDRNVRRCYGVARNVLDAILWMFRVIPSQWGGMTRHHS